MRGSVKANLIVFLIIAVIAFCISSAFASFIEPNDINYVPTVKPKNDTNTTNSTIENITYTNDTDEGWDTNYGDWEDIYEDWYNE